MDISVIGTGYVGLVTGTVLSEAGHNVTCADVDENKISRLQNGRVPIFEEGLEPLVRKQISRDQLRFTTSTREAVRESTVIYICVGTPSTSETAVDLSAVEAVTRNIASCLSDYRVIVEKSTVPVNTGRQVENTIQRYVEGDVDFDVVSNPEFLAEGTALDDARDPDRIVLGVESERAEEIMREIYQPFDAPLIVTGINSAELIKHASNSFLALKISYINAISRICELSDANVEEVARGMGMDPRIGEHFLGAGIGFGGSCFPKDVEAFHEISRDLGYEFNNLPEIKRINREQRNHVLEKIEEELWILKGKRIGVLGLSFKPGTDDIRESPAISLIEDLRDRGVEVRAHDPVAIDNAREALGETQITFVDDPYRAAEGAEGLVLVTDWEEYAGLDFDRIRSAMTHPLFVDGRNLYSPEDFHDADITYRSVGRPEETGSPSS